jgi:hypothetical protein
VVRASTGHRLACYRDMSAWRLPQTRAFAI